MDSGQRKTKRQTATAILKPYFEDEWISVYVGDVRDVLPKLLASLAAKDRPQMCISSPPYLGLRDYGVDSQIGLEATPAEFTAAMVTVFDGCRSVLKDDGTLFLNIGDSYNGTGDRSPNIRDNGDLSFRAGGQGQKVSGMKPKDLMLMPFEVARALRDAGWWLRQAFPWTKRSAMPGSQEDRATTALEWIFQLAKKKHYFYDAEAVRMGMAPASIAQYQTPYVGNDRKGYEDAGVQRPGDIKARMIAKARDRSNGNRNGEGGHLDETPSGSRGFRNTDLFYTQVDAPHGLIFAGDEIVGIDCNPAGFSGEYCTACKRYYHDSKDKKEIAISYQPAAEGSEDKKQIRTCICGRSDAWLSHFATFPMKLVTPFIRCGTSEAGECEKCGKAWVRVAVSEFVQQQDVSPQKAHKGSNKGMDDSNGWGDTPRGSMITSTLGFIPQCECDAPVRPQTVLDPFGGAGTTMIVAAKLGRRCISIELNEEYAAMSIERYKREMRKPVDPPRREEAMPLFAMVEKSA